VGGISDLEIRNALGALGLSGPKALRLIGALSGGEKARVALAKLALQPTNVMFLDEVTNHLDVDTVGVLVSALNKWTGTMMVITHDRDFARRIKPTHVAFVTKQGRVETHDGGLYESDFKRLDDVDGESDISEKNGCGGDGAGGGAAAMTKEEIRAQKEQENKKRKRRLDAPKRITKIEMLVEEKEQSVASLDEAMAEASTDVNKIMELSQKRDKLQEEIDSLYSEWEELEEFLAEAA